MKYLTYSLFLLLIPMCSYSQGNLDDLLPVRGLCMSAPAPDGVDQFIDFVEKDLVPRKINTLVLRIDFRYEFKSHPELVAENALSKRDVKKIVKACQIGRINLIPQVNLLGHQSWSTRINKLMEKYPQFNETPYVPLDKELTWPNEWGLYCLSYCPLHPEVHDVVFAVVDEIVEAFEAKAFHAGMDEVFYLGDDKKTGDKFCVQFYYLFFLSYYRMGSFF